MSFSTRALQIYVGDCVSVLTLGISLPRLSATTLEKLLFSHIFKVIIFHSGCFIFDLLFYFDIFMIDFFDLFFEKWLLKTVFKN